jgi:hypothetical protein
MRSMSALVAFSFVVAFSGFAQPLLYPDTWGSNPNISFLMGAIWALLLSSSLVIHGKRGLWALAGAPFALIWPAGLIWLYLVCVYGPECV